MTLGSLTLRDFRCFNNTEIHPSPGLNLVSAPNASGKSSLLEAICILLRLQSPRAGTLSETIRHGSQGFSILARVGHRQLACHLGATEGRRLLLDNVPQRKSQDYLRIGLVAFFSSNDIELIRGTSSKRRRFLDFLGSQCDASYLKNLRAYERALRARNFLLKEGPHRQRELAAYEAPFIENGSYLAQVRAHLCNDLTPLVAHYVQTISGHGEIATLHYRRSGEDNLQAALTASLPEEQRLRQTVIGPHRDDITLELNGVSAHTYASEGQQRTLALALRLAQAKLIHARRNSLPLYLLDDIFGELDTERRHRLLAALPPNAQSILTTTSWQWLENANHASRWIIHNKRLVAAS